MGWVIFVAGAVLSWGAYGALLFEGQTQLGNPLKALVPDNTRSLSGPSFGAVTAPLARSEVPTHPVHTTSLADPPLVAAVVWTEPSGNWKPPAAAWMMSEHVSLPAEGAPEMSQPVVRSGEVRKRKPPEARTTNELSDVASTSAPDADVERSP